MGKLRELLPIINIFKWADGNEYTVEEDTTILPPELAESSQKIEEQADKHFKTQSKGNGGKGRGKKLEGIVVEKEQLNTEKVEVKKVKEEKEQGMEIGE